MAVRRREPGLPAFENFVSRHLRRALRHEPCRRVHSIHRALVRGARLPSEPALFASAAAAPKSSDRRMRKALRSSARVRDSARRLRPIRRDGRPRRPPRHDPTRGPPRDRCELRGALRGLPCDRVLRKLVILSRTRSRPSCAFALGAPPVLPARDVRRGTDVLCPLGGERTILFPLRPGPRFCRACPFRSPATRGRWAQGGSHETRRGPRDSAGSRRSGPSEDTDPRGPRAGRRVFLDEPRGQDVQRHAAGKTGPSRRERRNQPSAAADAVLKAPVGIRQGPPDPSRADGSPASRSRVCARRIC